MRIAAYTRISSGSQKTDGQRAEIERYILRQQLGEVKWYQDVESGKSLARPAFTALQAAIYRGEVDTVIVYKLDRLSRSLREGMNLVGDWTQRGVRLLAITQSIDLNGVIGQMVASVLFAFAEIELQHTKERQRAGIEAAKLKHVYKGRARKSTKANPQRAKELRARDLTLKEIATALGVSRNTVINYLNAEEVE